MSKVAIFRAIFWLFSPLLPFFLTVFFALPFLLRFENLSSQKTVRGRPDSLSLSLLNRFSPIALPRPITEVKQRWARLVLGWETVHRAWFWLVFGRWEKIKSEYFIYASSRIPKLLIRLFPRPASTSTPFSPCMPSSRKKDVYSEAFGTIILVLRGDKKVFSLV